MNMHALPHLEASLRHDIEHLRSTLRAMSDRAERSLWDALEAVKNRNRHLAHAVVLRDQFVDEMELELDRLSQEFLIRHQPAGMHLRFVLGVIKIVKEIERVGDCAESVARQALALAAAEVIPPLDKVEELARVSIQMFHAAMESVLDDKPDLARSLINQEVVADHIRHEIDDRLAGLQEARLFPADVFKPMATIVRRYERVSDQACNICEEAIYIGTGEYVKHKGSEVFQVLLLDEEGSCLAPLAEAAAVSLKDPKFHFTSASLKAGSIDPRVSAFLSSKGCPAPAGGVQLYPYVPGLDRVNVIVGLSPACRSQLPGDTSRTMGVEWNVADPLAGLADGAPADDTLSRTWDSLVEHARNLVKDIRGGLAEKKA